MIDPDLQARKTKALELAVASERDRIAHGYGQADAEATVAKAKKFDDFLAGNG